MMPQTHINKEITHHHIEHKSRVVATIMHMT